MDAAYAELDKDLNTASEEFDKALDAYNKSVEDAAEMAAGVIVAIVIGSVCCCVICIVAIVMLARRKNQTTVIQMVPQDGKMQMR